MTLFRLFLSINLFFLPFSIFGQDWQFLNQIGNEGNESISGLETDDDGKLFICGQFDDNLNLGDVVLTPDGRDVFLSKLDASGNPIWTIQGSSPGNDLSEEMAIDQAGNTYWIGSYWIEADFANLHLEVSKGSKSGFIIKNSANGAVEWGHSVDGTFNKTLFDVTADDDQNVYVTGNFSDSLFFQDTILVAADDLDLFVLKLNSDGEMVWISQIPSVGYFIPNRMAVNDFGAVTIAGNFKGEAMINNDMIQTNTNDDDVFIAHFDANGMPLWGRRAGGVFEQYGEGLALDENGDIYVGGSFIGVMSLNDEIQIQSPNSVSQVFLLKYANDGTPIWARTIGGVEQEFLAELKYKNQEIIATGYYRGGLQFDDVSLPGTPDDYNAYFAAFDMTGQTQWVKPISASNFVFGEQIAFNNSGDIICAGSFNEEIMLEDESIVSNGSFDIYIAALADVFTNVEKIDRIQSYFFTYPNPVQDQLYIETDLQVFELSVYDLEGKSIYRGKNQTTILFNQFPQGIYIVQLQSEDFGVFRQKVVKY